MSSDNAHDVVVFDLLNIFLLLALLHEMVIDDVKWKQDSLMPKNPEDANIAKITSVINKIGNDIRDLAQAIRIITHTEETLWKESKALEAEAKAA